MKPNCIFETVCERDMDMLFLEEFVVSQEFADIFLNEIGEAGAEVIEVEHSKMHPVLGESDMVVVVQWNGEKHALLIEDKIDAQAMEEQYMRYTKRGDESVEQEEYDKYFVFMVAPQKYLDTDREAKEYPNKISYEKCKEYFAKKDDRRSQFKAQQIEQAIEKQKRGYQVQEDSAVTAYWKEYLAYCGKYYPELECANKGGPKGVRATWPQYRVDMKDVCIFHKAEKGVVDLNFYRMGEKVYELERELRGVLGDLTAQGMKVERTGGSAVLRREALPKLDFQKPFEETEELKQCFEAIRQMYEISKKLNIERISSEKQ